MSKLLPPVNPFNSADATDAFGVHLTRFPWQWYVTLTFRNEVGEQAANSALWQFNRTIRKAQGFAPGFIWVTERQRRDVPHFHGLMLNVGNLRRLDAKDAWECNGYARVEPYDPMRGANYYIGKYLFKSSGAVQVSRNLTRWYPDPDSPTVRALGKVFDVGLGQLPLSYTANAGLNRPPDPVTVVGVKPSGFSLWLTAHGSRGNGKVA